ncbi:Malic enzyme, NAD-binding [Cynara cardunculus var. scolymus]|uniref:Malic enzyme, NAD-binding n=1 Tax=Cynara cardunculus var. scolymus TaxID=59895 RepID=A0A103XW71_CYNCS|nr:Malic enzyme, NAD-binding [Cynara cardunculus var. scolymus]
MMSLNASSSFLKNSFSGASRTQSQSLSLPASCHRRVMVVAMVNSNGRPERNVSVSVDSVVKEVNGPVAVEVVESDSKKPTAVGVGGGVEDVYGEDSATEDHFITPWSVSVASGYSLLRDPHHNKGLAFTVKERDAHYLRGLLPPVVVNQDLQERNERLFYKLLIENVEELLPIVYTPTVGEACQKYGSIFKTPQGLFISLNDKGKILEILKNWPQKKIQVIVVTDGERILGLGDLGCQCLPITIDVGTNNEKMLNDEFYIGLRRRRASGQEYAELMNEFMSAVKQNYGEKVLVQGTASVVLAGLISALKLVGGSLADHRFLFLGAGETNAPLEETRKKVWLVDSKGLIVRSRLDSLQHFKKPWAHEHEPVNEFLEAVKAIRPTVLIGSSGAGQTFTKEVVEAMASFNESNNAYIFPGFGLGLIISGAIRVHDDMLLAASEALAEQVTQEHFDNGLIYPPFTNIRKISAHIAAKVAAKAYELGLASRLPQPENLVAYAESCMYSPSYRNYR